MGLLSGRDFGRVFAPMFSTFERSAFRFETRERYNVPLEEEPLRRFLAGEPDDLSWLADWHREVAAATAAGRQFMRVRVVSLPLSDYSRFGLAMAETNIAAGEDIRYLDRPRYEALGLPSYDGWLFDSSRLAILRFDDDDRMVGGEIITDPDAIIRHCHWRDAALRHATPCDQFLKEHAG